MATDNRMAFLEELRKYLADKDTDFLREAATVVVNSLMDSEVSSIAWVKKYERNQNRSTYRNGYRDRDWNTRLGKLELKIPKLRQGSYFPSLLEPRKRLKKALLNVVQEAYVHGVSTRKVDDFVEKFRNRKLGSGYPHLWLDATFPKVREGGRVCSMTLVIAVGVNKSGEREILGFDVGMSEDGEFWKESLRGLVPRG